LKARYGKLGAPTSRVEIRAFRDSEEVRLLPIMKAAGTKPELNRLRSKERASLDLQNHPRDVNVRFRLQSRRTPGRRRQLSADIVAKVFLG
jgi:hypothetical protein